METVAFCEIEPFCQQILKQHWPGVPVYGDIRQLDAAQFQTGEIDLITGGFPCQPFSCAGERKGATDDRHLWPEMFRLIAQTRPAWVVGENVPGIIGVELDRCLSDLEAEGYAWQTFIIPACAVDAPHRRERVWIVANAKEPRRVEPAAQTDASATAGQSGDGFIGCSSIMANTESQPLGCTGQPRHGPYTWQPEPGVGRVAHGIPGRVDRLKALGNAIVPQVAYEILRWLE